MHGQRPTERRGPGRGRRIAAAVLLAAGFGLIAVDIAQACNTLRVRNPGRQDWQGGSGVGYEVFDPASLSQAVNFTIRKRGPTGCNYFVAISVSQNSGTFNRQLAGGPSTLDYNVYQTASLTTVVKDLPTATASELIFGSFTGGGTQDNNHTVYFHIPPQQVVEARNHRDRLRFRVYEGNLASNTLEHSRNVTFRAVVPEVVELSIVDSGQPFDALDVSQLVNFGVLSVGASRSFDLLVRTNSGYDMSLQSDNSSVLRQLVAATPNTVPYTLQVDGSSVDLSGGGPVNVAGANGLTTLSGDRLPTTVTIGTIGAAVSGPYSDNINVVVTAR